MSNSKIRAGQTRGNLDPKIALLRSATTRRSEKRNIAGTIKTGRHAPAPITMPKFTFTEPNEEK